MHARLRTAGAVDSHDVGARLAQDSSRFPQTIWPEASRPSSLTASEVTTGIFTQIAKDAQREQKLVQRSERLQKNQVATALQQCTDLFAKKSPCVHRRKDSPSAGRSESGPTDPPTKISRPFTASRAT